MAVWSGTAIVGYGEPLGVAAPPDATTSLPDSRPAPFPGKSAERSLRICAPRIGQCV